MNIDFSQKLNDALLPVSGARRRPRLPAADRGLPLDPGPAQGGPRLPAVSVLAALGAVVAVFQWGWLAGLIGVEETGPIMSMMPIFMVGVVFGLAMDYEVFLVTRMREAYVHGEPPEPGGRHRLPARRPGGRRRGRHHDGGLRAASSAPASRWSR